MPTETLNCPLSKTECEVINGDRDTKWFKNPLMSNVRYGFTDECLTHLNSLITGMKNTEFFLNCLSEAVKNSNQDLGTLFLTSSKVATNKDPKTVELGLDLFQDSLIEHSKKPLEILKIFSRKAKMNPFEKNKLVWKDLYELKIKDDTEITFWLNSLLDKKELICDNDKFSLDYKESLASTTTFNPLDYYLRLSPQGWNTVEEDFKMNKSNKVFIAISFSIKNRPEIQAAIKNACKHFGLEALSVDEDEYVGGIMDRIISMINSSQFVVCDFTEHKNGVYYEAGYSEGMNKTVIYTVKKGEAGEDALHFDVKHLNFIVWDDPTNLETRLKDRFGALIR